MGDNGIQRGGFGVPKQGGQPPARRTSPIKVTKPKPAPKEKTKSKRAKQPEPKLSRAARDKIEARSRKMSKYEAAHGGGSCAMTALALGVALVGAAMTLRGLA